MENAETSEHNWIGKQQKSCFYVNDIIQPFATFNVNFIKSWIYSNLMEIGFYLNKREIEKNNCRRYDLNLRPSGYKYDSLASMAIGNCHLS